MEGWVMLNVQYHYVYVIHVLCDDRLAGMYLTISTSQISGSVWTYWTPTSPRL